MRGKVNKVVLERRRTPERFVRPSRLGNGAVRKKRRDGVIEPDRLRFQPLGHIFNTFFTDNRCILNRLSNDCRNTTRDYMFYEFLDP